MREQLIQYVDLLFAGADNCEDIKQEILQNTLDRYDDLISQGKVPEAAYRLAILGIGDINEILTPAPAQNIPEPVHNVPKEQTNTDATSRQVLRAVAIAMYILCPIPLFVLSELNMDTLGLCGTLAMVAAATMIMVLAKRSTKNHAKRSMQAQTPEQELWKGIRSIISIAGLIAYFIVSFRTRAWFITWLIFPLTAAIEGLGKAIYDLIKEVRHES